jgi:hypothetical protein
MFHNRSDSALQDLMIHDIVPSDFEIKGHNIRSNTSNAREAEIEKADDDNGIKVSWHIPVIEKDERIEVIYELVGDAGAEYKVSDAQEFHGATFGDELDVDLPPSEPEVEPEEEIEEVVEEAAEEEESVEEESDEVESEEESDDGDAEDEAESDDGDAEDEAESDDGDAEDEAESDDDATMDAALAQITGGESEEEGDSEESEEPSEADAGDSESQVCPICSSENAPGANVCSTCSFGFE